MKYVNTNQLQEVNIDCAFSGMKVYFDHADMAREKASVNVRLSFSGLELYVPKNWNVVDKNLGCTLGGVERRGTASETTDRTLVLNGSVSFSGVEIILMYRNKKTPLNLSGVFYYFGFSVPKAFVSRQARRHIPSVFRLCQPHDGTQ